MAADLALLGVSLCVALVVGDALWRLALMALAPWDHRPGQWTNRGDGMPRFRTFRPGRVTRHADGSITVAEVETTPAHHSNGG